MADTQITGTLSADEAINGSISANGGINAELTPNEEISGSLEVRRTQEIIQAVWGTITGTLSDQTDLQDALDGKADLENGKVPSSQLPSYVDDVLEYASLSVFPATGEAGKIYIALDTNKTYRWSGSTYVEISESLALGETTGTAYEGSKGKANADAIAKAYKTDDSAETDIQDADYIPFYDTSATAKKKSLWSNIKAKLNEVFFRRSEANVLGAKNLLPLTTCRTEGDITWTMPGDGTVVANGSSGSSYSQFLITIPSEWEGDFYFSGCPAGGSNSTYDVYAVDVNTQARPTKWDGTTQSASDLGGTSQEIKIPSGHTVQIACRIRAGQTVNNLVFKPMLRLPTDLDNTFEPFAMTNKALTDTVGQNASDISDIEALIPSSATTSNQLATASDIPDITSKADLVTSATSGDFAGLDANGNLTDSGISADIVPSGASSSNKLATANDIPSLTNYVEKSETAGLLKNDGTVDTTQYVSDISGKVDNSVVAPVESGATASRAYAIGENFIKDGAFCTAKAAIAQGATFTLNTNYTAGNIADIAKTEIITPTAGEGVSIEAVSSVTKYGHIVCANMVFRLTGTFAYKATILSGLPKPPSDVYMVNQYTPSGASITFNINTSGVLEIRNAISPAITNVFFVASVSYITNE